MHEQTFANFVHEHIRKQFCKLNIWW